MSFITFSLFWGGAIAATVPVLLHLLMRGKPKRIEFPALMFVRKRLDVQRRSYRLKHLILLTLRISLFVLLGLALARPLLKLADWYPNFASRSTPQGIDGRRSFVSNLTTSLGSREAPIAAALVIDSSIRMRYRAENQTRLEVARDFARWILKQLPPESVLAVLSTDREAAAFQIDILAAEEKIERLQTVPTGRNVAETVLDALSLLSQSEHQQRELYILTDLSEPGWPDELAESLRTTIEEMKPPANRFGSSPEKELGLFVVDVGLPQPIDSAISRLALSTQTLASNAISHSTLHLEAEVTHLGPAASKTIDLILFDPIADSAAPSDSGGIVRDTKTVDFPDGESRRQVVFTLTGLEPGFSQGRIRFTVPDALPDDDGMSFSVQVRPASKILLVAQPPIRESSLFVREALETVPFEVVVEPFSELTGKTFGELQAYGAVLLLDPSELPPAVWKKLADYVSEGGGVGVFLGSQARTTSLNDPSATEILGVKLVRQARRPDGDLWMIPENEASLILSPFRQLDALERFPWDVQSVFRYWETAEPTQRAEIALPFSDGRAALVTQQLGRGRTLTMTTPVSETGSTPQPWNILPWSEASYMFLLLTEGIAKYLIGNAELNYNFTAGEPVVVRPTIEPTTTFPSTCLLATPDGKSVRLTPDVRSREIRVPAAERPGNYRIRSGGTQGALDLGFSVNIPGDELSLRRIDRERLDKFLGDKNYRLVRTPQEVELGIARRRIGQELYTPILLLLIGVFIAEYLFSNRFYGKPNNVRS